MKIKFSRRKATGNAGSVDYEQDYLSNKEIDMEYKFKPFDLETAKAGAPVMTRAGFFKIVLIIN